MTFEVLFQPELPDHGAVSPPPNVNWTVAYGAADARPDYDLRYLIAGKLFCYYPASLATLLGDLLGELEALGSGKTHNVSMSGYTLMLAEIAGDTVTFSDAGAQGNVIGEARVADVCTALRNASERLWAYLEASGAAPPSGSKAPIPKY